MLAAESLAALALAPLTDAALLVPFLDPTLPSPAALVQAPALLTTSGGLLGLERAPPVELQTRGGLPAAQAAQLGAALALARRLVHAERPVPSPYIFTSFAERDGVTRATDHPMDPSAIWRTVQAYATACGRAHL